MPKNKGNIKAGQRGRADENNEKAIGKLLADGDAAKKEWAAKPEEWRKANPFIPEPLVQVTRVIASPSNDWFTIVSPSGRAIQVRGLDKGVAHTVAQLCKQCKQTQAGSDTWPMVIVSLPEPSASRQTGEILAVLDSDQVSQFADLGFKVTGIAEGDDLFDRSEAAGGGGGEEIDLSTI
jgi:hypothetical protein